MAKLEFPLPIKGVSKGTPIDKQAPLTSPYMNNVRPRDVLEKRIRIGQMPGMDKWSATQVGGQEAPVVAMCTVTSVA